MLSGQPFTPGLHVAMASPEVAPFAWTGGLGDVLGSLPRALEELGVEVSVVMPAYRCVLQGGFVVEDAGLRFTVPLSGREEEGRVLKTRMGKHVSVYLVQADRYYDREDLYGTSEGDYADNAERFVFFSRAVLEILRRNPPHVLHCHDWQSALAIAFLRAQPDRYPQLSFVKTVFTVHNLGYQGLFWHLDWHLLDLDWAFFTPQYLEFYGRINFLKGGLVFADVITTVSPTYAEEIKTPEQGFGLEGVLHDRGTELVGILNGVDYEVWNPETDPHIARNYGPRDLLGKADCKVDLQRAFDLPQEPGTPLIGMVTRLTAQKGLDLLQEGLEDLLRRDIQFVLLGRGELALEEFFLEALGRYPGKMGLRLVFDTALAHKVIAGADMLLMPSRYEPCGLNQMYSLKYGTIPIVRAVGGLRDTVEEFDPKTRAGNGLLFFPYEAVALIDCVDRALAFYHRKRMWRTLVKNAMASDFSWGRSGQAYLNLYQRLPQAG